MLPVSWDTVRLFLHVLAATVWVGGRLVLVALVPALRRFGTDVLGAAARRFNQVAWVAFAVLVVTGIWNIVAVRAQISHSASYRTTLIVKLVAVAVSGLAAGGRGIRPAGAASGRRARPYQAAPASGRPAGLAGGWARCASR